MENLKIANLLMKLSYLTYWIIGNNFHMVFVSHLLKA